jgi:hypothetical protein
MVLMASVRPRGLMAFLVFALALALTVVSAANAKLGLSLELSKNAPKVHEPVVAVLRSDSPPGDECHMKLLAVAPGVSKFRALAAFISGGVSIQGPNGYYTRKITPTPRMGFLISMKQVRRKTWRTAFRFPRRGAWKLVVPNECAPGYMSPSPVDRVVNVR